MAITYLKQVETRPAVEGKDIRGVVAQMLAKIEEGGEAAVRDYARDLDGWAGDIVVTAAERAAASARVSQELKDDIRFAHANIRRFAEAQKATMGDCEIEIMPGLIAGQKQIPVSSAGCYVPGGRYSHIASALMTITTAKVAGVPHITACSPTRPGIGIPDPIIFAMDLCGADLILNLGGVQGVAAMSMGLFGGVPADILVGPGNSYVAEAKRMLFGAVGIDMFAGPTDSLVVADHSADPETVAWDLVSQAEHGADSPVWLVTTDRRLAETVLQRAPDMIDSLPEPNASAARVAWAERAEVVLCDTREEAAQVADRYAPEHLQVQAKDLDWWLNRLSAYGSLFLGEETTVAFGDKTSGPNHVLPTSGAARYTGGLSVHKFTKTVTWQRCDADASHELALRTARISRMEGMEGHARSAELRLKQQTA
ncbi:MAG: histidinol dehydrogenase [Sulfitobacter sp.]|jgi:sulfopropanediol 3-dehydrogenase|uniref:histidinol dehydrogenase n=1 Tax=unclassified Sulfitobacter TaxID=196795 RepID=UPI0007C2A6D5|nr:MULTISPECIES: histidinol dehydrogenase [unclassified Sulfitobacter]KZX91034.1 histidinol dehydrogenase [Sulfitobacter sp. HI0021]KZX99759.1 histidinol dehydrogenase [Sulfitobacter sp. HI0027]KZZ02103.1 histidinol dehydrogenase [Sulfitobacter sp. HI0076]